MSFPASRQPLEAVRAYFRNFGESQAPANGSPLYAVLSLGVLDDPELLELATHCSSHQPSANLLFAAVHARLLGGDDHALRAWYPDVLADPAAARVADAGAVAAFRDFALSRRDALLPVLRTRRVQTNVVRRTSCLVPMFAEVARRAGDRPLALLELGCSAGLNLHWDRYAHAYTAGDGRVHHFGDRGSALCLATALRSALPDLPAELPVAWRAGIDLDPIDPGRPDELLWLRALVFPEHVERHAELLAAATIASAHPVRIEAGDAVALAPDRVADMPEAAAPCLYASMVLNQIPRERREALFAGLAAASRRRPIWLVSMDGNADGASDMRLRSFQAGELRCEHLAACHSHGRWLAWESTTAARPAP